MKGMKELKETLELAEVPARLMLEASAIKKKACSSVTKEDNPRFVHLCGIPGSGKSSYAKSKLQELPNTFLLRFDEVMESLSGYQRDLEQKGPAQAFALWEIPARILGYHLLISLVEGKRNILFDHSAAFHTHIELIKSLKSLGYTVEMHRLPCELETAKQRVRQRNFQSSRHTPERLVEERYTMLETLVPRYRELVDLFIDVESP